MFIKIVAYKMSNKSFFIVGGSTLEAMSNAIEEACVVLIFFSEPYKNSVNCRAGKGGDIIHSIYVFINIKLQAIDCLSLFI